MKFIAAVSEVMEAVGGAKAIRNSDNLKLLGPEAMHSVRNYLEQQHRIALARLADTGHDHPST